MEMADHIATSGTRAHIATSGTGTGTGNPALLTPRRALSLTSAGLSLIAVCYGMARFAYGLFVPVFRAEFTLDAATAGAIASGSYASYCVAIIVSTVLTPRFGGRALAVAAGIIAVGGTLTIAAAPNAAILAVGVLIAGSSTGIASPPLAHAVTHAVAAPMKSRTQTVINAGTGVGVAVAGPIALLTHEQWRAAWLTFTVVCALVTVWVALIVPAGPSRRSPGHPTAPGRTAAPENTAAPALLPRPVLPAGSARLIAASGLMGVASAAVWTFGRDVLVSEGGLSEQLSMIAWIILGAFGILGATAGDIAGRLGIRTAWPTSMLVLAAATALIAAFPSSVIVACVAAALFGAAYIALTGLLLIWGIRVYRESPAAGVGIAFLVIAVGQAVGAPIVGTIAEAAGARIAFMAAALIGALAAVIRPHADRTATPPSNSNTDRVA